MYINYIRIAKTSRREVRPFGGFESTLSIAPRPPPPRPRGAGPRRLCLVAALGGERGGQALRRAGKLVLRWKTGPLVLRLEVVGPVVDRCGED